MVSCYRVRLQLQEFFSEDLEGRLLIGYRKEGNKPG